MNKMPFVKKIPLILYTLAVSLPLNAQNMNNPYSIYGVGDLDYKAYNRTDGMGGTGLAIKSSLTLVDNNPAAIAGLTRSFYLLNAAASGRISSFKGDAIDATNSNAKDFWIKRFAFAVKLNKSWASSLGFGQISNVNYKLSGKQSLTENMGNYQSMYEGDGGLNEYYLTNAVSLGKHLSLGIKSAIVAGAINQTEVLTDESSGSVITTKQQDYIGDFRFQGGILFDHALNKKWNFSAGAKYIPTTSLNADRTISISENETAIVEDSYIKTGQFYLPKTLAAGIALKKNNKTTFAADYTYEDWSSLKIKERTWQLISNHRISAGVEFSQLGRSMGQTLERKYYQVGGYFNTSYLQIRNQPIREYGLTAGMGGWLNGSLLYSLSLEAGVRGTTAAKLIKENYVGLSFTLSYRDLFRTKVSRYN